MTVSAYVYHHKLYAKECRKKDAMHYLKNTVFSNGLFLRSSFIKTLFVEFRKDRMFLYERKTTNKEKLE